MQVSKSSVTIDRTLDVVEALCPLPLLKLKLCLKEMQVGQVVELLASDITSVTDIPAYCRIAGHHLIDSGQRQSVYFFIVQKSV